MLTVHASGGKEMMEAAMDAVSGTDIKILGVTVLTSLDDKNIIKKKVSGSNERELVAIVQPITGGNAPAAPPITMF